jgi:hypothetical protein
MVNKQFVLIILLLFGLGGLAVSTYYFYNYAESWIKKYDVLKNDYDDLQIKWTAQIDEIGNLKAERNSLEDEIGNLKAEKTILGDNYNDLQKKYRNVEIENHNLRFEKKNLELTSDSLKDIVEEYQKIPKTPATSDINYKLYGGPIGEASQIAISYPNLSIGRVRATGSMSPGISSQSTIIETTNYSSYNLTPGQIIVYENSVGEHILHRIHDVDTSNGFCYETKGDANFYSDPDCVQPEQIRSLVLGVLFREPDVQYGYCKTELTFGPESQYCPY